MCTTPADSRPKIRIYPTKATRLKTFVVIASSVVGTYLVAQETPPPDSAFESGDPFTSSGAPGMTTTPSAAATTPAGTNGNRFQQGNPFDRGQLTGAQVDLSKAPGLDPSMQDTAILAYGLRARSQGNVPAARAAFQTLLARDPNNPQYARLLSELPAHDVPFVDPNAPKVTPPPTTDLLDPGAITDFAPTTPTLPPSTPPADIVINPDPGPMVPSGPVTPPDSGNVPPLVEPTPTPNQGTPDLMELDLSGLEEELAEIDIDDLLKDKIKGYKNDFKQAKQLIKEAKFPQANQALSKLRVELQAMGGPEAGKVLADVNYELDHMLLYKAQEDIQNNLFELALKAIEDYELDANGQDRESRKVREKLRRAQNDPYNNPIENVSPGFINEQSDLHNLLIRAKTQFVNGDYEGALETYRQIDLLYPNSKEAKYYQLIIAEKQKEVSTLDRKRTVEMLKAIISGKWQMPVVKNRQNTNREVIIGDESPLAKKLKSIVIPDINLSSTPLTQAIAFLSQASELFDFSNDQNKGVNIIPNFDPSAEDPLVNLILRNMTLERVLEVLVDQVGYSVELAADVVLISKRKGGKFNRNYTLEFYPLSPSMVLKLTGGASAAPGGPGGAGPADPFGPAPGAGPGMGNGGGEEQAIIDFFIRSGIPLDDPESSTSFDGSQLIVRHNQRTHSMIQDLLRRYDSEATQVEIEAKFLEVQQGDLEELGFNWGFHYGEGDPLIDTETGKPRRDSRGFIIKEHRIGFTPQTRSLADAFTFSSNSSQTTISRGDDIQEYDNSPPRLPNTLDLANGAGDVFKTLADVAQGSSTILGAAQVDLVIKALQRSSGTELLSAPRVTVNNQGQANITIAQEFRYPEDYDPGQIAQSGTGFTGAVPNTFTDRNVGVELSVSPQVGANDTISLHLEPTVTEFEGFVEYGGNNVVISGSGVGGGGVGGVGGGIGGGLGGGIGGFGQQEPVVIVQPSGIYQPIFSVRRVVTDVTIYDGATVVIGGLTREEVKTVNDRVPVLSNIPGLGRLFRSEGESSLKRNLMIFVTGNIISPGGGPARQDLATIERGSVYQNPIVITPAGPERRSGNRSEN